MSLEFSRRSFLKYTAVAAVAVAGSSLLTGCGSDSFQPEGRIGDTLKVMGTFQLVKATYENNTLTCPDMYFKCTSTRSLSVVPTNFQIDVTDKNGKALASYRADQAQNNKVSLSNTKGDLEKNKDMKSTLKVENMITLSEGDIVLVKYWPRPQASQGYQAYTDAYATWKMTYINGSLK